MEADEFDEMVGISLGRVALADPANAYPVVASQAALLFKCVAIVSRSVELAEEVELRFLRAVDDLDRWTAFEEFTH